MNYYCIFKTKIVCLASCLILSPFAHAVGVDKVKVKKEVGAWDDAKSLFSKAMDSGWYKLVGDIEASMIYSTFFFYKSINYQPVAMPVTSNAVSSPMGLGSDSLPVEIELFNQKTYLADSMQFQLEYLLRQGQKGVFYIMPTFRGEDHDKRHLNQFFHSEAELRGNWDDAKKVVTDYILKLTKDISDDKSIMERIKAVAGSTKHIEKLVASNKIPSITFDEAIEILKNKDEFVKKSPVRSLSSAGERRLIEVFDGPVWVTHFDSDSVPFYQASIQGKDGVKKCLCGDLLMGIGETVGAGQRHTYKKDVLQSLREHQNDPSSYDWYVNMKEAHPMVTSGFGLGMERYILWLLNHDDIRDVQIFNRLKGYTAAP